MTPFRVTVPKAVNGVAGTFILVIAPAATFFLCTYASIPVRVRPDSGSSVRIATAGGFTSGDGFGQLTFENDSNNDSELRGVYGTGSTTVPSPPSIVTTDRITLDVGVPTNPVTEIPGVLEHNGGFYRRSKITIYNNVETAGREIKIWGSGQAINAENPASNYVMLGQTNLCQKLFISGGVAAYRPDQTFNTDDTISLQTVNNQVGVLVVQEWFLVD